MVTDSQRACKCGINVADFLNDISILEGNLRRVEIDESATFMPAFRSSINSMYNNIRQIENDCYVDTSNTDLRPLSAHVDRMQNTKSQREFETKKSDIYADLSRIRYGIVEKVRECSRRV